MDITIPIAEFLENSIKVNTGELTRVDADGERYYYTEEYGVLPSVTTVLSNTLPKGVGITDYQIKMGAGDPAQAKEALRIESEQGTLMHIILSEFLIAGSYDFDSLNDRIEEYMQKKNIPWSLHGKWVAFMKKAILSFHQFVRDKNLKPLAVEVPIVSKKGFAGTIDIIARINDVVSMVDMKKSAHFFETHALQLAFYKDAWNEVSNSPVEKVYNWRPKNFRKEPSYELKDQTSLYYDEQARRLLELYKSRNNTKDVRSIETKGVISFDKPATPNYRIVSIEDKLKSQQKDEIL
jgi:hypothetical protein